MRRPRTLFSRIDPQWQQLLRAPLEEGHIILSERVDSLALDVDRPDDRRPMLDRKMISERVVPKVARYRGSWVTSGTTMVRRDLMAAPLSPCVTGREDEPAPRSRSKPGQRSHSPIPRRFPPSGKGLRHGSPPPLVRHVPPAGRVVIDDAGEVPKGGALLGAHSRLNPDAHSHARPRAAAAAGWAVSAHPRQHRAAPGFGGDSRQPR